MSTSNTQAELAEVTREMCANADIHGMGLPPQLEEELLRCRDIGAGWGNHLIGIALDCHHIASHLGVLDVFLEELEMGMEPTTALTFALDIGEDCSCTGHASD